jgi:hypothetical protein
MVDRGTTAIATIVTIIAIGNEEARSNPGFFFGSSKRVYLISD